MRKIVRKFFIYFIRNNVKIVFFSKICYHLKSLWRIYRTCWVIRRNNLFERFFIRKISRFRKSFQKYNVPLPHFYLRNVTYPRRSYDYHFISNFQYCPKCVEKCLFPAIRDDNLIWCVIQSIILLKFFDNTHSQFLNPI